ncbi:MAG: hypothetical protein ACLTG0_10450 [Oscillibacter sp.]
MRDTIKGLGGTMRKKICLHRKEKYSAIRRESKRKIESQKSAGELHSTPALITGQTDDKSPLNKFLII